MGPVKMLPHAAMCVSLRRYFPSSYLFVVGGWRGRHVFIIRALRLDSLAMCAALGAYHKSNL